MTETWTGGDSGSQTLSGGGDITGFVGGEEYGLIFQESPIKQCNNRSPASRGFHRDAKRGDHRLTVDDLSNDVMVAAGIEARYQLARVSGIVRDNDERIESAAS